MINMEKELMEIIENKEELLCSKILKEMNKICENGNYEQLVKAYIAFEVGLTEITEEVDKELTKAYDKYMKSNLSFEEIIDNLCTENEVIQEAIC